MLQIQKVSRSCPIWSSKISVKASVLGGCSHGRFRSATKAQLAKIGNPALGLVVEVDALHAFLEIALRLRESLGPHPPSALRPYLALFGGGWGLFVGRGWLLGDEKQILLVTVRTSTLSSTLCYLT